MAHDQDSARLDLLRLDAEEQLDFRFVAEAAGDRELSPERDQLHQQVRRQRGRRMFADLLFVLTHLRYSPERAQTLWDEILRHKRELNRALGRNVGVAVAAVDYLTNVEDEFRQPTLIALPRISAVAEVATRDGMTGLYDHSSLQVTLRRECRRHQRQGHPLSLIMLDVDRFKQFNDTHGHQEGDRVLAEIARVLQDELRDVDTAARYGGEEFAIVAPSTSSSEARTLAERVRRSVERELAAERITVSLGVATSPGDGRSAAELIEAADGALYESKRAGRNRTTVSTSSAE
jgi:diguanylate cyclase (GGDEF)-like protein